jgi:hypothetical protein
MRVEAHRVLKPDGALVIGFIDRDSPLGRDYLAHQAESVFYPEATFHSAGEDQQWLGQAGFTIRAWGQTLSHSLAETREIEPLQPGVRALLVRGGLGPQGAMSDRSRSSLPLHAGSARIEP